MRAVDLFCGAGGASLGLHQAGFEVVGFDHWQPAIDTHNSNGLPAHLHDLSDPEQDHLIPECDLLWASPPCQPFSAAGDQAGEFDGRDGFPWLLRIVGKLMPPVVCVENVKGLTFATHADYFGRVLQAFTELGYRWEWRVLNCADLGVPQTRERCIIVARLDQRPIVWPAPTHTQGDSLFLQPWVTMAEALGWAGELSYRRGDGMIERHGERGPWDTTTIPAPTVHRNSEKDWRLSGHIDLDEQPAPTIPELARLQGFPDTWQWCGTKTDQARQIGNAVPPVLAQRVVEVNRP
jgi:DNA (cytosine-5)-methyltransferase 1